MIEEQCTDASTYTTPLMDMVHGSDTVCSLCNIKYHNIRPYKKCTDVSTNATPLLDKSVWV